MAGRRRGSCNWSRVGLITGIAALASAALTVCGVGRIGIVFLQTLFAVASVLYAGLMFVISAFPIERIPNKDYYLDITRNHQTVRETGTVLFAMMACLLLMVQTRLLTEVPVVGLVLQHWIMNFTGAFAVLTGGYAVLNARVLHDLRLELDDLMRGIG